MQPRKLLALRLAASLVVDSMAMCLLAIVSFRWLAASRHTAELAKHAATLGALAFGGGCVALGFAFLARERAVGLLGRVLKPLSPRVATGLPYLLAGKVKLTGLFSGSAAESLRASGVT